MADRIRDHSLAILFATHVGNDHADGTALARDLIACSLGSGLVLVRTCHGGAFPRTQDSDGSSIADGRVGVITRLRSRADYQDAGSSQPPATRGGSRGLSGRPDRRAVTASDSFGGPLGLVFFGHEPFPLSNCTPKEFNAIETIVY
jgi:hypothetical protein